MDVNLLIAAASALFAGLAILSAQWEQRKAATFEHIRTIDSRLQPLWRLSVRRAQENIVERYRKSGSELTEEAVSYLAFLNAIDLMAFAYHKRMVARRIAAQYVRTLCREGLIDEKFIVALQDCCKDPYVYADLLRFLKQRPSSPKEIRLQAKRVVEVKKEQPSRSPNDDRSNQRNPNHPEPSRPGRQDKASREDQSKRGFPPPPPERKKQ